LFRQTAPQRVIEGKSQGLYGPRREVPSDMLHRTVDEKHRDQKKQKRLVLQPAEGFLDAVFEELHCFRKTWLPAFPDREPFLFVPLINS